MKEHSKQIQLPMNNGKYDFFLPNKKEKTLNSNKILFSHYALKFVYYATYKQPERNHAGLQN